MRVEYLDGMINAICDKSSPVGRVLIEPSGPYLDDARNQVVANFLADTHLDYLLFIDSDIYFTTDHIRTVLDFALAQPQPSVVSGAYRTERNGSFVVAGARDPKTHAVELLSVANFRELQRPIQVDGVGAGFLLIPRVILVELGHVHGSPCPYFAEPVDEHGIHLGEDYGFCDRVTKLGHPIYLHPDVKLTHIKQIGLTL